MHVSPYSANRLLRHVKRCVSDVLIRAKPKEGWPHECKFRIRKGDFRRAENNPPPADLFSDDVNGGCRSMYRNWRMRAWKGFPVFIFILLGNFHISEAILRFMKPMNQI